MEQKAIKCMEIDQTLLYKQLPAHMIVTNFIAGEDDCNYEIYIREFINESSYFLALSNGQRYEAPQSESNKEPDAISDRYKLDFKLMVATSRMEANSILSGSITKYGEGAYGFGASKVHGEMRCILLCQALRYKSISELEEIKLGNTKSLDERDIKDFLKVLQTEKNVLLFLPFEFSYSEEDTEDDGVKGIAQAIYFDLRASIAYRENKLAQSYDTYAATIYKDKVRFFKLSSNGADYIDSVDIRKSKTFMKLYDCGRF